MHIPGMQSHLVIILHCRLVSDLATVLTKVLLHLIISIKFVLAFFRFFVHFFTIVGIHVEWN